MTYFYAIRKGKVVKVAHLRGKLYILATKEDSIEIRDGKKYAANPADELLVSPKKLYSTHAEAEQTRKSIAGINVRRREIEKQETEKLMAERDDLIEQIFKRCAELDVDCPPLGFLLPDELRGVLAEIERCDYEQRR